jgi:hypothetical protein
MLRVSRVVITAIALAGFLAGPTALIGTAGAASGRTQLSNAYFLSGQARAVTARPSFRSSFDVDRYGDDHILMYGGSSNSVIRYYTRKRGSTTWQVQRPPSLRRPPPGDSVSNGETYLASGISTDGRQQYAVAAYCKGIFASEAPVRTATLPKFHAVVSEPASACHYRVDTTQGSVARYALVGAVAMPKHQIGIFVVDLKKSRTDLYIGRPGHGFTRSTASLPAIEVGSVTYDAATGELVVVRQGYDESPTDNAAVVVFTKPRHGPWSGPVEIASGSSTSAETSDYDVTSVAATRGKIMVGLGYAQQVGNGASTETGAYVVRRTQSGTWSRIQRVPQTKADSGANLLIAANPATGHFHAVFTRYFKHRSPDDYTLLRTTLVDGKWAAPKLVTRGNGCRPQALAFNPAGNVVVAYTTYVAS